MMPTDLGEQFPNLNSELLKQGKMALKFWQDWGFTSQPGALRQQVESVLGTDWKAIQNGHVKTYVGTVQVSKDGGKKDILGHKTFSNKDLSPPVIAASGTLIGKTEIANDYYVDGAYLKNPSMDELDTNDVTDIIAIVLYPQPQGPVTPKHEDDIRPERTEFIGPEVYQHLAWLHENTNKRIHVIAMPHDAHWNETSKMNISRKWIGDLYKLGYEETQKWIAQNSHKIGKESSFNPKIACGKAPCSSCNTALECEVA
ncbi:MAG: hypothetical protein LRZ85_06350 [Alphaproteobacteria bacterium]|nr:hypothetical protein [Alphaproteobacteria bacterium]